MEAQNNLSTGIDAGTNVFEEISLNIDQARMVTVSVSVSPEELRAERRKILDFICALEWAAYLMSIHMAITLIEILKYVISGAGPGPDGTCKIPEISILIILIPLVVIFLLLVILKPDQSQHEMLDESSPDSDCVGIIMTVYLFVVLMLFMWIGICFGFGEPAGRSIRLLIILIDLMAGFYFLCSSWTARSILMMREKQLSEIIETRLEMRNNPNEGSI